MPAAKGQEIWIRTENNFVEKTVDLTQLAIKIYLFELIRNVGQVADSLKS